MADAADLELGEKEAALEAALRKLGGVLVAFSGGVDSTYLLHKAVTVLGAAQVLAVTAESPLYPAEDIAAARRLASSIGARHLVIVTDELSREEFRSNPPDRCYYCKTGLFAELAALAREHSLPVVADGSNLDDTDDYRPGSQAARECGVRSPLQEAGLTKAEIRRLSRRDGLPTWDKPAAACLASRFPYGERLDSDKIEQVDRGERFLRQLGLRQEVRVRCHGRTARIEVTAAEMKLVTANREAVVDHFKQLGFLYVALDLEGFRTGSMNLPLSEDLP